MARTMTAATEIDGELYLVCAWFAKCENVTRTVIEHSILGPTPCCTRCATRMDMVDKLADCEITR